MSAYFPESRWYDAIAQNVTSENGKETLTLDTPIDQIQVDTFVLLSPCLFPDESY